HGQRPSARFIPGQLDEQDPRQVGPGGQRQLGDRTALKVIRELLEPRGSLGAWHIPGHWTGHQRRISSDDTVILYLEHGVPGSRPIYARRALWEQLLEREPGQNGRETISRSACRRLERDGGSSAARRHADESTCASAEAHGSARAEADGCACASAEAHGGGSTITHVGDEPDRVAVRRRVGDLSLLCCPEVRGESGEPRLAEPTLHKGRRRGPGQSAL